MCSSTLLGMKEVRQISGLGGGAVNANGLMGKKYAYLL